MTLLVGVLVLVGVGTVHRAGVDVGVGVVAGCGIVVVVGHGATHDVVIGVGICTGCCIGVDVGANRGVDIVIVVGHTATLDAEEKWLIKEVYQLASFRSSVLGFPWHVDRKRVV